MYVCVCVYAGSCVDSYIWVCERGDYCLVWGDSEWSATYVCMYVCHTRNLHVCTLFLTYRQCFFVCMHACIYVRMYAFKAKKVHHFKSRFIFVTHICSQSYPYTHMHSLYCTPMRQADKSKVPQIMVRSVHRFTIQFVYMFTKVES